MLRLKEKYQKEIIPAMMEKFQYKNSMAVPKIETVIVNIGFGRFITGKTSDEEKKIINAVLADLTKICGQKAIATKAKKSIAGFKIRQGQLIGAKVVLRRKMMHDFLERLIHIVLPRSRDFRGIDQNSFDEKGNLTIGIREHIAFPEIAPEEMKLNFGLEVTVVTTAKNKKEGIELLKLLGFPVKS